MFEDPSHQQSTGTNYTTTVAFLAVAFVFCPALLVISQAWYPGWRAYVDGQPAPLLRADYAIKAVPVPAGHHVVQLRFQSGSWARGLWLGLVGLVLLVVTVSRGASFQLARLRRGEAITAQSH